MKLAWRHHLTEEPSEGPRTSTSGATDSHALGPAGVVFLGTGHSGHSSYSSSACSSQMSPWHPPLPRGTLLSGPGDPRSIQASHVASPLPLARAGPGMPVNSYSSFRAELRCQLLCEPAASPPQSAPWLSLKALSEFSLAICVYLLLGCSFSCITFINIDITINYNFHIYIEPRIMSDNVSECLLTASLLPGPQ